MRAISLFSGAGGFELGFDRAGIDTIVQVEKDPWCLEVLARHWPDKVRVRDVEHIGLRRSQPEGRRHVSDPAWRWPTEVGRTVDLVYGGWPCQDLSVAGNRAGLRGERSGLFHELVRVVRELRPRWIAAENVLGLLSNAEGRDFAIVLDSLVECGYGVAWRVLDGRYFGVPQRRRRVLIVGCLGDATRAAQVLAVCESCGGHPAPRRTPRQDVAYSVAASAQRSSNGGNAWNTSYVTEDIAPTLMGGNTGTRSHGKQNGSDRGALVAAPLTAGGHSNGVNMPGRHKEDDENLVIARGQPARESGYRMDFETENFLVGSLAPNTGPNGHDAGNFQSNQAVDAGHLLVASPVRASDGHHGYSSGRGDGADNLIAFDAHNQDASKEHIRSLRGSTGGGAHDSLIATSGVRRLTPLECERLMGWPDEHTRWTSDGCEISDAHRYRMCGNGVIATMAEWLGHRLVMANAW